MNATDDVGAADLVVVNTCAFIEDARRESIDTVLALADARRAGARLVVTGCLAERYGEELADAIPEVDAVVGFDGAGAISTFADPGIDASAEVAFLGRRGAGPSPQGVRDLLELPRGGAVRAVGVPQGRRGLRPRVRVLRDPVVPR